MKKFTNPIFQFSLYGENEMNKARKLYTFSSSRVFLRGCVFALFVAAALTFLSSSVKADMIVFWNFDSASGSVVTDSVRSEPLNLVNSSIEDGKLTANGGYALGTGTNNGVSAALPTGTSNYTLSAFLTTTRNGAVGIISWGVSGSTRQTNSFRTDLNGINNYWWGDDLSVKGYAEVISGFENHVVATGAGRTQSLYLNGQLIGTRNANGDRSEENRFFTVGNTVNNNTETLYGSIDNAAVYNEALEQAQIITISASKVTGLTNWWKSGTTVDRISGIVKPDTVTGTTVINGANGDVMVFNRALESSEQAFYEGQLATGHGYVMNNLAYSDPAKTTWFSSSSANLNDMTTVPLGIYVGGTTSASTLTATAAQLNSVNRTFVLGGGTLAISSDSDVSVEKNRVGFDSGSISTSGTGTITFNSSEKLSLKNVNLGTNSKLAFNSSDDMRVIDAVNLDANSAFTITSTGAVQTAGTVTLGSGSAVTFNASDIVRATGAITLNSGSAFTINTSGDIQTTGAINLGENSALTFNTPGSVRPTGAFTGKGDLVKSGTGNMFLTVKSQSYEGTVKVNGGTLTFSIQDVFGWADRDPYCSLVVDNATVTNNAAVFNNIKNTTFKNGAKIVAANGNGTWKAFMLTGNTNIAFSGDGTTAEAPVVFEVASSATGDARTNATICPYGNTFNVADITKSADPDLIITAVLANTNGTGKIGSFTKTGAGTLKLAAANTFNGNIDIQGGTIVMAYNAKTGGTVNTATALGNPSLAGRKITIHSGATLTTESSTAGIDVFGGADAYPKFRLVADGGTIATSTNQLTTYGDIELKNGGKFVEKGGEPNWKTIINGDVYVTAGNATISSDNNNLGIVLRGLRNGREAGVTFDVASESELSVSAHLSDSTGNRAHGSIIKTGEGTMILSNNSNDYTGNIVVDEGILKATTGWRSLGSGKYSTVFGYYQAKTVTVNSGAEVILAAQDVVSDSSHSTPIQFILDGGKISNEGAVYNNLNNTVFKNGAELYASNGHNDWKAYKLSTKVSALRDKPSAQPVKITASDNGNATISFGDTTSLYVEDVTSASATELDTKSDLIISAKVTNPHNENNRTFYKDGAGILEFTAANTYNGTTNIRAGVLRLSGDGTLGSSAVPISSGATLEFLHTAVKTFGNVFSGAGEIVKNGTGTLTLTGANTYSGGTTVSAGVLELLDSAVNANGPMTIDEAGTLEYNLSNGQTKKLTIADTNKIFGTGNVIKTGDGTLQICTSAEGQVDVNSFVVSSGRLDMKEYYKGTLEVGVANQQNNTAVFSPGNSVGTLNVDGDFVLNSGATLLLEQDASGMDKLVADSFTIATDSVIELSMSALIPNATYDVIVQSDGVFSEAQQDPTFWTNLIDGGLPYYLDLSVVNGNTVRLHIDANAIPEPSTWALLVLGVVALFLRKRVRS